MIKLITLREFLSSSKYAKKLLGGPSWAGWRALLLATMGEALTERADFTELTLRLEAPSEACREAYFVVGRRGKSRAISVLAAFLATCIDYRSVLAPREVGELVILAQSTDKAKRLFGLVRGTFDSVPFLKEYQCNARYEGCD